MAGRASAPSTLMEQADIPGRPLTIVFPTISSNTKKRDHQPPRPRLQGSSRASQAAFQGLRPSRAYQGLNHFQKNSSSAQRLPWPPKSLRPSQRLGAFQQRSHDFPKPQPQSGLISAATCWSLPKPFRNQKLGYRKEMCGVVDQDGPDRV